MLKKTGLGIALALLAGSTAYAACTQADLAGSWQAYAMSASNSGVALTRCKMSVNGAGTIAASSICTDHAGNSAPMQAASVKLTVGATCTFNGQFRLGNVLYRILHGTVASDKKTASGMGTFPGGGFFFTLSEL